jgi:FimV-like protein
MQRLTPVLQQANGQATQRVNQPETSAMDMANPVKAPVKAPVAAPISTLHTPLTEDASEKLQLATVYLNMGDLGMARTLIHELLTQGNEAERRQAQALQQELFDRS